MRSSVWRNFRKEKRPRSGGVAKEGRMLKEEMPGENESKEIKKK